jgi:hypothetical protein
MLHIQVRKCSIPLARLSPKLLDLRRQNLVYKICVSPVLLSFEIYLFLINVRRYAGFEVIIAVASFF